MRFKNEDRAAFASNVCGFAQGMGVKRPNC
jgi:hypothetical protein